VSFSITNYGNGGLGEVQLSSATTITGGASNGLHGKMVTVSGFSGTDANGFDTSLMNGTWYCDTSTTTYVVLLMYIPLTDTVSGTCSGPTFTVGSDATVKGFFVDGWVPPRALAGGGVAGFFLDSWAQPAFFSIQSPYFFLTIGSVYPTEGQLFPTGQVGDNDYITVAVKN